MGGALRAVLLCRGSPASPRKHVTSLSVSVSGTICNPGPRKSMSTLLYARLALFLPEIVWASLGAVWVAESSQCDKIVVSAIIATVVIR